MLIESRWLGTVEYQESLHIQTQAAEATRWNALGTVLGLEHPEVITLGIRGTESDILTQGTVPVVRVPRGGQATFHNPGQLVIYPICPLRNWQIGVKEWVDLLLTSTKMTLLKCNIIVEVENNGLISKNGKICSLGLNIKNGVSTHGLALNVSNDLMGFSHIQACGVRGQLMDRVVNHFKSTPKELFELWVSDFEGILRTKIGPSLTSEGLQI